MSDGWDIVSEYADTVASMVETENELKCEIDRLREELELQRKIDLQIIAEKQQLRGNLSLAEEGLANYAQEVERLQRALYFWLPHVPAEGSHEVLTRVGDDAMLLVGYDPTDPMELDAEARGWITLNAERK